MRASLAALCIGLWLSATVDAALDPFSYEPAPVMGYAPAVVELTLYSGEDRLPGLAYLAGGAGPHPTVVLLHGLPGNERNLDIAQVLRRDGFNVVFFNYRGAWGADGTFSLVGTVRDALAVLAQLREPEQAARLRVDTTKLSVLGHSLGGFTALAAGATDDELACVGAMAPANLGFWKAGLASDAPNATARLPAYADSLFMLHNFSGDAMRAELAAADIETVELAAFAPGFANKSVFMIVGDRDSTTPLDTHFVPVVDAYRSSGQVRLTQHIISGDHSFSWSRLQLTRLLLDWLRADCS